MCQHRALPQLCLLALNSLLCLQRYAHGPGMLHLHMLAHVHVILQVKRPTGRKRLKRAEEGAEARQDQDADDMRRELFGNEGG